MRPREVRAQLLDEGRCFVSRARLCSMLGVSPEALPSSLRRAAARGDFVRVCRGGWVARDDASKSTGRPLPDLALYVDDMMAHLGHRYYLGFNAAAAVHGVLRRGFTNTVVVTSARTTHRTAERHPKRNTTSVTYMHSMSPHRRGFDRRRLPEGFYPPETFVNYSTAEVTLLDMAATPAHAGGLDQVATVALELVECERIDPETLATQALGYPQSVRRRAGHILDAVSQRADGALDTDPLVATISTKASPTPLMPGVDRFFPPEHDDAPIATDSRWRVRVNTLLDPDG